MRRKLFKQVFIELLLTVSIAFVGALLVYISMVNGFMI